MLRPQQIIGIVLRPIERAIGSRHDLCDVNSNFRRSLRDQFPSVHSPSSEHRSLMLGKMAYVMFIQLSNNTFLSL